LIRSNYGSLAGTVCSPTERLGSEFPFPVDHREIDLDAVAIIVVVGAIGHPS